MGVNHYDLDLGTAVLRTTPKPQVTAEQMGKMDFIKVQTLMRARTASREQKDNTQDGRRCVHVTYLRSNWNAEYTESSHSSLERVVPMKQRPTDLSRHFYAGAHAADEHVRNVVHHEPLASAN